MQVDSSVVFSVIDVCADPKHLWSVSHIRVTGQAWQFTARIEQPQFSV